MRRQQGRQRSNAPRYIETKSGCLRQASLAESHVSLPRPKRHMQIEQNYVRPKLAGKPDRLRAGTCHRQDGESTVDLAQATQRFAELAMIIGDQQGR